MVFLNQEAPNRPGPTTRSRLSPREVGIARLTNVHTYENCPIEATDVKLGKCDVYFSNRILTHHN